MGSIPQNDPLLWDSETLSKELCSQHRRWIKNPAALAAKLADEEIDGHTLLTFEFLCSRKELMECLNITTARSKAGLAEAILSFQARSQAFRLWKKNFLSNKSKLLSYDERDGITGEVSPVTRVEQYFDAAVPTPSIGSIASRHQTEEEDDAHSRGHQAKPLDGALIESDGDYPMLLANDDTDHITEVSSANRAESPPFQAVLDPSPAQHGEERSSKRRRLAPTNISGNPPADSSSLASKQPGSFNLVNTVTVTNGDGQSPITEIPPEYAYLGDKGRPQRVVLSHVGRPDLPWIDLEGGGFAVVSSKHIKPPGQRLAINSMLRRYFSKNSRKEATLKRGFVPQESPTPSDESETVIDLDDLPDSWDEETQREIDEEQAEVAARERELARYLTTERVDAILKDEMAAMKAKWEETKLPRYERKAYQFWMDAKRKERIKEKVFKAQRDAERYERRLKKMHAEIFDNSWQTERELRIQASVMEQSLGDKLYSIWLIALLEKRDPPPKPLGISRPKSSAAKTRLDPFGDEVLTSSDEDEFIVPDDDDEEMVVADEEPIESAPRSPPLQHGHGESHAPSEIDDSMVVDLTELESPEKLRDSKAAMLYIDLTSPIKSRSEDAPIVIKEDPSSAYDFIGEAPPMDQLGSLETINEHPAKHWAKLKDRWRLILCLLWKLTQVRRGWVLRLMQEKEAEEAWQASIQLYQANPFTQESDIGREETRTVAFDLTKLFFSCTQCRYYTDDRVMTLDKKDKNRIARAKPFFPAFHAFVREWASEFPQSSQIFRTDAYDDEIGLDDTDDPSITNTPSKTRKHVAKEIVQNKEGFDLREREKKRAEEQEARRLKLRAALATSNAMTQDKSRLIINESKQDDQSFIYINGEIGKRIKDHQINGVRFLWNQIVLDTEVRQGCLLAHTMGLGKTMQVITFLVAVLEAANSDDETIKAQVPKDLRKSQSLILCPAGLVDNWLDEILMWSPKGLLGNILKVESAQKGDYIRLSTIKDWERDGGVLVVGHEMFKKTWAAHEDIREILTRTPNIVICDEAHMMQNPNTQLHRVCQDFRTRSRIALTGSPLSNSVNEYYSMINWVAPKFLGPPEEFRDIYVKPIEDGLGGISTGYEKRKALKMLEVLKMNVAPKVQRATIQCVRHELPAKYEFVIFVEPTPIQKELYDLYLNEMASKLTGLKPFSFTWNLGLVCNHPRCFRQKVMEKNQASRAAGAARQQPKKGKKDDDPDEDGRDQDPPITFSRSMISAVLKKTNGADISNPTLSRKVELLLIILDEARAAGDKTLIFSQSIPTLNYLEELLRQQGRAVCRLDGSTAVSKRQEMVKSFNSGRQDVYLISTRAGGVGLNIFGANRVVIFDFKWNPVTDQQAVGRAYRFGQKKTVYVYRLLIAGSFEEELQKRSVFKLQLASRVVDKKNPISWGQRNGDLLHPITTKPARDISSFVGRDRVLDKLIKHSGNSGVIREIVSTDTFEEEDPTNELTAEERKDAQELHELERLKYTDPQKYRQMWDQKQRADQIRAMATAAQPTASPLNTQMPPPSSIKPPSGQPTVAIPGIYFHGAAAPNENTAPPLQTQPATGVPTGSEVSNTEPIMKIPQLIPEIKAQSTPNFSSSAPLPMAGANTYIGRPISSPVERADMQPLAIRPSPQPSPGAASATTSPVAAPTATMSLFSQPRSQSKIEFENELARKIEHEPRFKGGVAELAEQITTAISQAQKKQGHGFLPDNARWRLLLNHIQKYYRFKLAIIWGSCTPDYLASAPEEEIQKRISVMNEQSQEDFGAQLQRGHNTPDPSNLNNINRLWAQSGRASEDAQVMRRAADKRTERRFRLPPWGYDALSNNSEQNP